MVLDLEIIIKHNVVEITKHVLKFCTIVSIYVKPQIEKSRVKVHLLPKLFIYSAFALWLQVNLFYNAVFLSVRIKVY